ncbi:MAG TPA: hypothetical protein HA282_00240, partial [Nanoarchaeota archaeon]|nr:hypothetical protein [Nanoarchaeota archaeon]
HIHTHMATKTISITEDAYKRLEVLKTEKESFSDIINKITKKKSLLDIAGILTENEARILENRIKKSREASRKRMKRIRMELAKI